MPTPDKISPQKIIFHYFVHSSKLQPLKLGCKDLVTKRKILYHFSNQKVFLSFTSLKASSYFFLWRLSRKREKQRIIFSFSDETEFKGWAEYLEIRDIGSEDYRLTNILVNYFIF